ncbi:MAG: ABC transporter substrate-binding protein [Candidatus Handelsmanbacteria bacterium RIFCSPLOWO2_12_FULL_64_10]|uniref:1,4-dihydroxy-6-naphtoate synthase n=1 Tax=Handelsmanbacteria sp. (strain RIFCSPLOWO2_12_FULL_64_10) TaxID=1817868 RepID=A0A1F6D774_HANXR|nr:MAG: ABC transporter substrate-binding protein [Candidatus Handelsmanbacteria bacterium RIFCSPLOWO2_12_FULL_64_10]
MPRQTIRLGHSPDSDDAFMFYALAKGLIDTGGFEFVHVLQDIETLNRRAMRGELEVTAVSIHACAHVLDRYALMPCGASLGDGYGPMVVARTPISPEDLRGRRIAIPGTMTSAYLALRLCLGDFAYDVVPFDRILEAVAEGRADAGLIIHEGQLTYARAGCHLVVDLGVWWKAETGLPLPLGGNVIRKDLGVEKVRRITDLVRQSVEYGLSHRERALDHALGYARGMDRGLADRFVGMYVNAMTLDYGPRGRQAVELFLRRGYEAGVIPRPAALEFVE